MTPTTDILSVAALRAAVEALQSIVDTSNHVVVCQCNEAPTADGYCLNCGNLAQTDFSQGLDSQSYADAMVADNGLSALRSLLKGEKP